MSTPSIHRSRSGLLTLLAFACFSSLMLAAAKAQVTTVFYILLENRCFTSGTDTSQSNILFQNKLGGSPYLTSLCTPGSTAYTATYQSNIISQTAHSSFCSAYHHVFSTYNNTNQSPYGANVPAGQSVHPSEPNYVFMEAGSNLSILSDNEPYAASAPSMTGIDTFLKNNPTFTGENLSALLQNNGITWTSYTEGTCLLNTAGQDFNSKGGTLTNNIAPVGVRTVPISSFSGNVTGGTYTNVYSGSHQYNFATKHTGQLFFTATNGGTVTAGNTSPSNVEAFHYAPLEQLDSDLANNTQAQYCVITPDQYNDGHTALSSNFTYHNYGGTGSGVDQVFPTTNGDLMRVAQMDNFCAIMVPKIMSSPVYQAGHAAIVIWTDETEGGNDFYHTLLEIVISPMAKGNGYNSTLNYSHSSDVATMQKIFGVTANTPTGFLNDAANPSNVTPQGVSVTVNSGQGLQNSTGQPFFGFGTGTAQDLSDLFVPGTIPANLPGLALTPSGYVFNRKTNTNSQTVTVTNTLSTAITSPI
ncbi:MAG TPA: hypothetical protein VK968_05040, partial [Roseimicrobium sp.]|nr:hypothetical protein [Roseimicrobium sp.]